MPVRAPLRMCSLGHTSWGDLRTDAAQQVSRLDPKGRTNSQQGRQIRSTLPALQATYRGPVQRCRGRELYLCELSTLAGAAQVLTKCHDLLVDLGLLSFNHIRIIHA